MRASLLDSQSIRSGQGWSAELCQALRRYYTAQDHLRRGICLLSAGRCDDAIDAFRTAWRLNPGNQSLAGYLAAAYAGAQRYEEAARLWTTSVGSHETSGCGIPNAVVRPAHQPVRPAHQPARGVPASDDEVPARIRAALALWKAGRGDEAIQALRDGVRRYPESAEVHYQLGCMLAERGGIEEAELRFTTATTLDKGHGRAWESLAMCHGAQGEADTAVHCLRRAQALNPADARLGLLLASALKAARGDLRPAPPPAMPAEASCSAADVVTLSEILAAEPDFVEAVLSLPQDDLRPEVYALMVQTLQVALERNPEHADLHFHCGCALARTGRTREAIASIERAVGLRPRFTKALIQLAKLYAAGDRHLDARRRLEEAVRHGAEYADVYLLLGNLYREGGMREAALVAYRRALRINPNYRAAREALALVEA